MTVINPNSISGITSITLPAGGDNVLTIHTNDGVERFRIDSSGNVKVGSACTISPDGDVFFTGVCTATTLAGSGANLTALPAANLTGALPAISGANLTGIAATDNVRTGILDVAGIATFRNDVNIGTAVTISESGIEATGVGITCANINGTQIGGRRNLVINGAMNVAQRGTSSTTSGMYTVDRFSYAWTGQDEAPTQAQVDVSSGTTPYTEGFRKAYKVTNGNQTSGAGASDILYFEHHMEAQDLANSGWNYTSSSSFITLSFWVKSSVSQDFKGYVRTPDGTSYTYAYSTGTLSANTWTKVTKTIPGNSNLTIDNDTGQGFQIYLWPYIGTTYTDAGVTEDAWTSYSSSARTPVSATSWWTTNDATFEITGVQLEVGSQATPFEHRSFGEELSLCQRYYYEHANGSIDGSSGETTISENCCFYNSSSLFASVRAPVTMRAQPSLVIATGSAYYIHFSNSSSNGTFSGTGVAMTGGHSRNCLAFRTNEANGTNGHAGIWRTSNYSAKIAFSAEL